MGTRHARSAQYEPVNPTQSSCNDVSSDQDDNTIDNSPEKAMLTRNLSDEESHDRYADALNSSKRTVMAFFVAGVAFEFFHTNRMSIYVLYAKQFNPSSWQIGLLLYCCRFWNGIAAILYGSLANQFGYDKICVILLCLQCAAVLIESIAFNFYMLFAGIMLGQVAMVFIVFGCIAWMLPEKDAKQYTSHFYVSFALSYLLGPISAGLLSFYVSYRMVFIMNCGICAISLLFALVFIARTQSKLEREQLEVGLAADKPDEQQFPICLQHFREQDDRAGSISELQWYQMPEVDRLHAIVLCCILYILATVAISENAVSLYYCLYVIEEMDGNVIIGTAGILLMGFGHILGNVFASQWCDTHYKQWTLMIALCIMALHAFYLYPTVQTLNVYYALAVSWGVFHGLYAMVAEMILLEVQPTRHSGKINGVRGLIANWISAFALLGISLWFDADHNAIFSVTGMVFVVGVLLAALMIAVNRVYISAVH